MEWIASLNRALRYMEDHLTDESLNVETVAKVTAYSPFYLQRLFYILTDLSLSEYIRQRRLSMAGQELRSSGCRVIDVALKYGYETPESFQKAFRRFHGVSPSTAQKSRVQLRYLNPLQIKVELTGGSIMDYSLENLGEQTVLGMVRTFRADDAHAEIPKFWNEYSAGDNALKVPGMVGLCFDDSGTEFRYLIGSFCEANADVPTGFEKHSIGAHLWARFRAIGPIPTSIQQVTRQAFTEWLPNNPEYDLAEGLNLEVYSVGNIQAADYESEVWLPVQAKN